MELLQNRPQDEPGWDGLRDQAWERVYAQSLSCVQLFETLWTVARQAPHPWDLPGKNTGVCCHFLLQGRGWSTPHTEKQADAREDQLSAHLPSWTEKAMAPHSSAFAWKIPWMEGPGRLQFMGSPGVGHD